MRCFYSQTGRSMIEMLGVLAIIAVLSVEGIAGYSKAMEQWKMNKWQDSLICMINDIQTAYINQKNYTTSEQNLTNSLISADIISANIIDKNNKDLFGNI